MVASQFLVLVTARLPRLLLGACKVMQFPLVHGCLLHPVRSLWSMHGSGTSVGSSESSSAGLKLLAVADGGSGVAILLGP